jgi:ABC-type nitrate/sulfonate/bicarbonate transport system permease component
VFAVLILLSVLGVALHLVMQVLQKKLIFWAEPEQVIGA